MKLPETCIRQPVLAVVLSLVLVVLGLISFQRLEIRFFPKLELPVVSVHTYYEGASAALMESQVTRVIENALAGVDGVQYVSSRSSTGYSSITVQFSLGGDFEQEAAQVRDKVASVQNILPVNANKPTVTVGSRGNPLMGIGFIDATQSPPNIRDTVDRSVVPILRQLPGVGSVSVQGASDFAMRIWLNASKMAARGVTVEDVKTALTANNMYFPAGSIHAPTRNYTIISNTRLKNAEEFGNIIVKHTSGATIRFNDIAKVELGYRSFYDYPMRVDGKNGILLIVEPLQSANPIKVAQEIHQAMGKIRHALPAGMSSKITFDTSGFLKSSIDDTFLAIGEAILLVILVIVLFLGSLRAASIPIVTIPVSLIAVFAIIKLLGFTINTMSLLAMVLAIGLVVDDAIVMMENIHRHIEQGLSPLQAALKGSKEISYAVVAMSVTLLAVYAPIGFVQGFTAGLFQEFAFTLAGAVLISGFVALTLSPMMCSRILTPGIAQGRLSHCVDQLFLHSSKAYQRLLEIALRQRLTVVVIVLLVAVAGFFIYSTINSEFIPQEDYGVMNVTIASPTGSNLAYTDKYTKQVESILRTVPQIKNFTTQVTNQSTMIRVEMQSWNQRKLSTEQVIKALAPRLEKIPGVTATASIPNVVDYGEQGSDVTVNFMTTGSYKDLLKPINHLMATLKDYPGLVNVRSNLKFDDQQYSVTINRDLAAELGVNIQDIADTISAMMSGNHWTDVQSGSRSYDVIVQMRKQDLKNLNAIKQLYVAGSGAAPTTTTTASPSAVALMSSATPAAGMVPLSSLVTLTPTIGQGSLHHFNRMRSGTITALIAPGYTESEVIKKIQSILPAVSSSATRYAFSGKAEQFLQSSGSMAGIMVLAFVFIYLVLSAQFGSFIDPLIILVAVPLSIVGALFFLWVSGGTFNLYSQIGLVTLVGMISKHGILITQFINDLRHQGVEFTAAIVQGAKTRFRPVLMTTAAMVFGSLPLVLTSGPGSVGRHQIGWVIVGGLIVGSFFSLIVVPVAYSYINGVSKKDL